MTLIPHLKSIYSLEHSAPLTSCLLLWDFTYLLLVRVAAGWSFKMNVYLLYSQLKFSQLTFWKGQGYTLNSHGATKHTYSGWLVHASTHVPQEVYILATHITFAFLTRPSFTAETRSTASSHICQGHGSTFQICLPSRPCMPREQEYNVIFPSLPYASNLVLWINAWQVVGYMHRSKSVIRWRNEHGTNASGLSGGVGPREGGAGRKIEAEA